jgi:ribosomal protein L11 methyltransferase
MSNGGSPYVELIFELGELDADSAAAACEACGAIAITFTAADAAPVLEPLPGEFRLWTQSRVLALFCCDSAEPDGGRRLTQMLANALQLPPSRVSMRLVADKLWEREWLKDFHAMRFGERLWICPHHETIAAAGAVVVYLDPGLAFGTGTHATTRLCLEWLEAHVTAAARVIDYGCGSGILALAALRLGAARAFCFDIDPQALIASADNARANALEDRLEVCADADLLPVAVDILVANILAAPLCALAARFASLVRPGGALVLAGLMEDEGFEVTRANDACFDMQPCGQRAGWVALAGRRREHC